MHEAAIPTRTLHAPPRPLLVYDGECPFCRASQRFIARRIESVDYAPLQEAASRFPDLTEQRFRDAVQTILPDGTVFGGAEAVYVILAIKRRYAWMLWMFRHVPLFAPASRAVYRWVANHRNWLS